MRPVALLMNTEDNFNLVRALSFHFTWQNTSESIPKWSMRLFRPGITQAWLI